MTTKQTKRNDDTITIKLTKKKLGVILLIVVVLFSSLIYTLSLMRVKEVVYPKPETVEWARSKGMTAL